MPHLSHIPVPAAAHIGWDEQFTRIARFAGVRVSRIALTLAQEALHRGLVARIQHRLYDDRTTTNVVVMTKTGAAVAVLTFVLNDGWALVGQPGALLETELRVSDDLRQVHMPLQRFSLEFSTDPARVYFNAGDHVDVEALRAAFVRCL